jgi:IRX15/GXM family protein
MDLEHLTRAFGCAATTRSQMTAAQYFRIAVEVLSRAPCRLLVVGAGKDTELYTRANAGGRTLVLERHSSWLETTAGLGAEVLPVSYQTRVDGPALEPCTVPGGVPPSVLDQPWDVILVDGPEGWRRDLPGRQQSIFLAAQLARANTTVLLHDYERSLEREFAGRYLKDPDEVHGEEPALAVFRY